MMHKIEVLPCKVEPKPGQRAQISFDKSKMLVPILKYTQDYLWVFIPQVVKKCSLIDIQGAGYEPPNSHKVITYIKKEFYFDMFYWVEYWQSEITAPLLIEVPDILSYGRLIPSKFLEGQYPWYSQYIASLDEIERLGVSNRVISPNYPHAIESLASLENLDVTCLKLQHVHSKCL